LDLGRSSAGLVSGVLAGDGSDAGQGRSQSAEVGNPSAKLALDGVALAFRAGRGQFSVPLGQVLDGEMGTLDQFAVLGPLLSRMDEKGYLADLIGQLL
jgi:hypothetical protein